MMPNFWRTVTHCIHKIKWFPPSMLTFGPKCSFLGYTIFQIWQGYYSRKTFNPLCFCHTGSWNSSQWSRDNLIDRLFLLLEFPFSKKFVHVCTLKHFLRKRKISFWCFKYQKIIRGLKDISTPDFSTPSFNPRPGVEKFMVKKSGVEKFLFAMLWG